MFRHLAKFALVGAVLVAGVRDPAVSSAATRYAPTVHNTGDVWCDHSTTTMSTVVTFLPARFGLTGFTGQVKTWTQVQYSYDGTHFYDWFKTPAQTYNAVGVGSTYFRGYSYTIQAAGRTWYIRGIDKFEWRNVYGQLVASDSMYRDTYRFFLNDNLNNYTLGSGGCGLM